ncbi:MAG: LuxR C-terminal-related transcriptional regulator [Coriobacteriales bacterium]|nr:LuxR C-terminal-related transcriptional regulator [Coriobacteriales bacterium]
MEQRLQQKQQVQQKHRLGAMELLGSLGFAADICVLFASLYWFTAPSADAQPAIWGYLRTGSLLTGLLLGYTLIRLLPRGFRLQAFTPPVLIGITALFALFPTVLCLGSSGFGLLPAGFRMPEPILLAASAIDGLAACWLILSWLDIGGRTRIHNILLFTTPAFMLGGLLLLFLGVLPLVVQPLFCLLLAVISSGLLVFVGSRSAHDEPKLVSRADFLRHPHEIEPNFFLYGLAFGMALAYLYGLGPAAVGMAVWGMVGGATVALLAALLIGLKLYDVVLLERITTLAVVGLSLSVPLLPQQYHALIAASMVGLWAMFTSLDFALLIKRCRERQLFIFWNISPMLIARGSGLVVGWLFTGLVARHFSGLPLNVTMVGCAFLAVAVLLVFWPTRRHHISWIVGAIREDSQALTSQEILLPALSNLTANDQVANPDGLLSADASARLALVCAVIAQHYQLSPRESEVLVYLAKGRNAAYIRERLCLSSNTVKTHINGIYHKLDVHSRQQILDFVEYFDS